MRFCTDQELKETYAQKLRSQGHGVSIDVPVGEQGALIDILTDSEIIVCTRELTDQNVVAVKSQLDFYGRFCPRWQKVVAVERMAEPAMVERLSQSAIKVVTVMASASTGLALSQRSLSQRLSGEQSSAEKGWLEPRFTYDIAHDYKSFEGGKGLMAALYVLVFVLLIGLVGWVVSLQKRSFESQQSAGHIVESVQRLAWTNVPF